MKERLEYFLEFLMRGGGVGVVPAFSLSPIPILGLSLLLFIAVFKKQVKKQ